MLGLALVAAIDWGFGGFILGFGNTIAWGIYFLW